MNGKILKTALAPAQKKCVRFLHARKGWGFSCDVVDSLRPGVQGIALCGNLGRGNDQLLGMRMIVQVRNVFISQPLPKLFQQSICRVVVHDGNPFSVHNCVEL